MDTLTEHEEEIVEHCLPENNIHDVLKYVWPKDCHPNTGEPFTRCTLFERKTEINELHYLPPQKPGRELYDFDSEENYVYIRDLTDTEYEQAMKEYEQATERWVKNSGKLNIVGPTTTTATFVTKSGSRAEGVMIAPGKWCWRRTQFNI